MKNHKLQLDCLVILDGNGTHKTANLLREEGLNVVTMPKTIDNDLWGTDMTFGFQSAVDIATGDEKNLKVPDDISVIGYDGISSSQMTEPKLTTLRQDTKTLGEEAGKQLLAMIEHPRTTLSRSIHVKGELLEGATVKKMNA